MKTVHKARPQYPAYRDPVRVTARYPVAELVLGAVALGVMLWAGLALLGVGG